MDTFMNKKRIKITSWNGDPQIRITYRGAKAQVWTSKIKGSLYVNYKIKGTDIWRFTWLVEEVDNMVFLYSNCPEDDIFLYGPFRFFRKIVFMNKGGEKDET